VSRPGYGRRGLHRLAPVRRLLAAGHEVLCVDNFYTSRRANIAHLLPDPAFEHIRHDVTFPLYVEVDEMYNLACPASDPLPARPSADHKDQRVGCHQYLGPGETDGRARSSGLD
jgi:nucleoside-diphosphate-sugar epimerase